MSEKLAQRVCPNCEALVDNDMRFCRSCGVPMAVRASGGLSSSGGLSNSGSNSGGLSSGSLTGGNLENASKKPGSEISGRANSRAVSNINAEPGQTSKPPQVTEKVTPTAVESMAVPVNSRPRRINKGLRLLVLTGILSSLFVAVTAIGLLTYHFIRVRRANQATTTATPTPQPTPSATPAATETTETLKTAANADIQAGKINEALEKLDRALKLDANNAELYKLRGDALITASRYAEAVESYQQSITRKNDDLDVYRKLGPSYEQLGQDDQAIETYNAALALKKDDLALRLQLARVLTRRGRIDEARKNYEQVLNGGDPASATSARQELARLSESRTNPIKPAKPATTPVVVETPTPQPTPVAEPPKPEPPKPEPPKPEPPKPTITAQEHIQRGLKLRESGDLNGALREYQSALKQEPGKVDAYYLIGMIHEQMGDLDGALSAFERCVAGPYAGVSRNHVEMIKKKRKK